MIVMTSQRVMDDLTKARSIVAVLRGAAMSNEGVRGEDVAHVCWAVEDLLGAAEANLSRREGGQGHD